MTAVTESDHRPAGFYAARAPAEYEQLVVGNSPLAAPGVSAVGYTLASSVLARLATVVRMRPAVARSSAGKSKIREVISSMAV
jgi:hypothetical protein